MANPYHIWRRCKRHQNHIWSERCILQQSFYLCIYAKASKYKEYPAGYSVRKKSDFYKKNSGIICYTKREKRRMEDTRILY